MTSLSASTMNSSSVEDEDGETTTTTTTSILSSLPQWDGLRIQYAANVTREQGQLLDILNDQNVTDGIDLGLCHLLTIMPFTGEGAEPNVVAYEAAIGVALAAQHLNVGDGSLITEVDGLDGRCNVRFTVEYADSKLDAGHALDEVVQRTDPQRINDGKRLPCAVIGSFRSSESIPTSIVSGLRNYPQISGGSTSTDLDDKSVFPKFARTIPSEHGTTEAAIVYIRYQLGLKHMAVITINDSYGISYARGFREAANEYAPDLYILPITLDEEDKNSIPQAMRTLKKSRLQFVYAVIISTQTHDDLMTEAVQMGVAGTGVHNWMFAELAAVRGREFEPDTPLQQAYSGAGTFRVSGRAGPLFDDFSNSIKQANNPLDLAYINTLISEFNQTPFYGQDTFLDPLITDFTLFFYEAALLVGLSACAAVSEGGPSNNLTLTGDTLYEYLVNFPSFQGVTGQVELDPATGSRIPNGTYYEVTNFVPEEVKDQDSGKTTIRFKLVVTDQYHNGTWVQITPFTFNDGTTNLPYGIPQGSAEQNYISTGVRVMGYIFCAVSIFMAIGFGIWTYRHRGTRVVKASQPFFLYLICAGCLVWACTIIPLSFDSRVASIDGCSIACTSTFWLLFIGCALVFSALVAKTHRINTIVKNAKKFRRVRVNIRDTLKSVVVILTWNIIVLSLFTALDPPSYSIQVTSTDEFDQPKTTYGQCDFLDSIWAILTLTISNFSIILWALWEAWQARNLSTEFAESQSIFRALTSTALVVSIGIPVLVLARDNPSASLFVSSGMTFISTCAILTLIFVPKIQYERKRSANQSRQDTVRISGLNATNEISDSPTRGEEYILGSSSFMEGEEAESGERILTTKTQKELAEENALLKRLLRREREASAKRGQESGRLHVDNGDGEPPTEDVSVPVRSNYGEAPVTAMEPEGVGASGALERANVSEPDHGCHNTNDDDYNNYEASSDHQVART